MKKQTHGKVLLILDTKSEIVKKFQDDFPYAIILLDKSIVKTWVAPVDKNHNEKLGAGNLCGHHTVPNTFYMYEQNCIVYWTKADYNKGKGIYQDYMPESAEENAWEYTASLI